MGWPVKVYNAIYSGEAKIQIPVFEVHARCYSAVMVPIARRGRRGQPLTRDIE
jgi:hypothetical protein